MGSRVSVLESRHVELGAGLADWNDMAVAWSYKTSVDEEHAAVREAAGLFDLSGLRKVHIKGPDALAAIDYMLPREMTVVPVGKSVYSTILTDDGGIADDAIAYRLAEDHFLLVYGTGDTMKELEKACRGKDATFMLDDDMHCISLQGITSVDFLDRFTPIDMPALKYFHQQETTLFGYPAIIARTGYSGERGYDIFASADVVGEIWDNILKEGAAQGIRACSFVCLNTVRIEAGLLFYPFDMSVETSPWEAGLGWSVSKTKEADFIGKEAVFHRKGNEKIHLVGIVADHDDAVGEPIAGGERVFFGGKEVGKITASLWSPRLGMSVALAHVQPGASTVGSTVIIHSPKATVTGTVSSLPFYDPEKTRTRD